MDGMPAARLRPRSSAWLRWHLMRRPPITRTPSRSPRRAAGGSWPGRSWLPALCRRTSGPQAAARALGSAAGPWCPCPNYPEICAPRGRRHLRPLPAHHPRRHRRGPGARGPAADGRSRPTLLASAFPNSSSSPSTASGSTVGWPRSPASTAALECRVRSRAADAARFPPRPGPAYSLGDDRVDRRSRQRARRRLRVAVPRRTRQRRTAVLGRTDRRAAGTTASSSCGASGRGHLVMGAAFDPTGDTSTGDRGGSSLAATLALGAGTPSTTPTPGQQALAAMAAGTLRPLRRHPVVGVGHRHRDPTHNVAPVPDYTRTASPSGLDDSPTCLGAVLAAVNHAHALEGIRPMVLPAGLRPLEHARPALRRRQPRAGRPWAAAFRRTHHGARPQRATRRRRRQRPARPGRGLRPRRRRVGRRVVKRARRRLRVDVRRRFRQRQPRLPAPTTPPAAGGTARASSTTSAPAPTS